MLPLLETDEVALAAIHAAYRSSADGLLPERVDDLVVSDSDCVFMLRASKAVAVDDPRRAVDFPSLPLKPFWVHPDPSITRMTTCQVTDYVFGLEWLLISDVSAIHRDDAWFTQFQVALELARRRVYWLCTNERSKEVLDVVKYAKPTAQVDYGLDVDYESDSEARLPKRMKILKFEKAQIEYRVNDDFIHDMNVTFNAMDDALYTRYLLGSIPEVDKLSLHTLRSKLYAEVVDVKEDTILTFRREWYQNLVTTDSHRRIHCRANPHDYSPKSRAVMVKKHEELAFEFTPSSYLDMASPPSRGGEVDIRLNADCMLFYCSASVPNGDFVHDMWLGDLDWRKEIGYCKKAKIGRLPAEQRYVLFVGDERWWATSFCAAFAHLRNDFHLTHPESSKYDSCF